MFLFASFVSPNCRGSSYDAILCRRWIRKSIYTESIIWGGKRKMMLLCGDVSRWYILFVSTHEDIWVASTTSASQTPSVCSLPLTRCDSETPSSMHADGKLSLLPPNFILLTYCQILRKDMDISTDCGWTLPSLSKIFCHYCSLKFRISMESFQPVSMLYVWAHRNNWYKMLMQLL